MTKFEDYKFEEIKDEHTEEMQTKCISKNRSNPELVIWPSGCVLNKKFQSRFQQIHEFEVYPDDTWVVTFPKCGTTWTQEMVWLLKNNFDFERAKRESIRTRFPFLELEPIMDTTADQDFFPLTVELAKNTERPRCIKSHLPPELLPKQLWTVNPKIVYVSRNPNDAVVSYYHHHRLWNGYTGSLEDFFNAFIADRVIFSPYWSHVLSFWKLRERENVLFNVFEEMKRDLSGVIRKTAEFLNVPITEDQVKALNNHLSFKNMKRNKSVNYMDVGDEIKRQNDMESDQNLVFMRSGESGGWQKVFTDDMKEKMAQWTKKHLSEMDFDDYPWS